MNKRKSYSNEISEYILAMIMLILIVFVAKTIGLQGIGYFGVTIAVIAVVTSVCGGWSSSFLAKYIKGRSARKQYRNAAVFWKSTMLFLGLFSAILSILLFLFSNAVGEVILKNMKI